MRSCDWIVLPRLGGPTSGGDGSQVELTPEVPIPDSLAGNPRYPEPPVLSAAAPQVLVPAAPPLPSTTPSGRVASAASGALEEAHSTLDQLQDELQGPDRCRASGCLELISGWLRADSSVRAAWGQAEAAVEEGQKVVGLAAVACDAALKDAKAAEERCRAAEAEPKTLHDRQATEARRLEVREGELKAR